MSVAVDEARVLKKLISEFLTTIYGTTGVIVVHLNEISKTKDRYVVQGRFQDTVKSWFDFKIELDTEYHLLSYKRL